METRVSVVIPAYNAAGYITRALGSLGSQTHKPDEIIIIDDGSSDGTHKLVVEFSKHSKLNVILQRQENKGSSAARNAGIALSTGELIVFLDADDTVYPDFINQAIRGLSGHRDWVAWFCDRDVVDTEGNMIVKDLDHPLFRSLLKRNMGDGFVELLESGLFLRLIGGSVIPMTIVCRRNDVEAIGGFDEELKYTEDRLFLLKMARRGKFGYTPESLGTWQKHAMSKTSTPNVLRTFPYIEMIFLKLLNDNWEPSLTTDEKKQIKIEQKTMATGWLYAASSKASGETLSLAFRLLRERRISVYFFIKAIARYFSRLLS